MEENNVLRQYVKRSSGGAAVAKKIAAFAAFAVILAIVVQTYFFRDQIFIIAIGSILIFSALLRNMSVEYEYTLSDGLFTVHKCSGIAKRSLEVAVALSGITEYAEPDDENYETLISSSEIYYDLASSKNADGRICFFAESQSVAFVIEPNEEMRNAILGGIGCDL